MTGLLFTALVLGFFGSLHCAGMCGPLMLALPRSQGSTASYAFGRVAYNVGRIATYCVMGVMFGVVGHVLVLAGIQRWASIALGAVLIVGLLMSSRLGAVPFLMRYFHPLKHRMGCMLLSGAPGKMAAMGALNGLLPCGLVYVACAGATAAGGAVEGAAYMAAFGLGTLPMMLGIGLSSSLMPVALRIKLRSLIPVSVVMLAGLLILRGMALGIPYVSPSAPTLAKGSSTLQASDCCHPKSAAPDPRDGL